MDDFASQRNTGLQTDDIGLGCIRCGKLKCLDGCCVCGKSHSYDEPHFGIIKYLRTIGEYKWDKKMEAEQKRIVETWSTSTDIHLECSSCGCRICAFPCVCVDCSPKDTVKMGENGSVKITNCCVEVKKHIFCVKCKHELHSKHNTVFLDVSQALAAIATQKQAEKRVFCVHCKRELRAASLNMQ